MKIIKIMLVISCMACAQEPPVRIIGQEVCLTDQEQMKKITCPEDLKLHDTVAIKHNGSWLYARVQSLPETPTWMGLVNWYSANPEETFRGQAINFQRQVRKLPAE